jgi:phospholipid/cholesterol/gamma-HCH transport system ATP-binding protein
VHKAFGANVLLRGASLVINKGETLAIIGESGSGKSIFLKMLIGLIDPDQGQIRFKGEDVVEMEQNKLDQVHRQIGYVFQNDALFDSMTILDNIGYGMREHTKSSEKEIRSRALECLEMVGLQSRILDLHPAALSGGMRKRVGIARAIAIGPEVLMYDEPTQGLDPQNITRIAEMIQKLQVQLQATSVVVTHDMRTAFGVSDRIALLDEQQFEYVGSPRELIHSEAPPVREFIAEAMEELRELPLMNEA